MYNSTITQYVSTLMQTVRSDVWSKARYQAKNTMLETSLLSIRIKVLALFMSFTCLPLYYGTTRSKKIFLIMVKKHPRIYGADEGIMSKHEKYDKD